MTDKICGSRPSSSVSMRYRCESLSLFVAWPSSYDRTVKSHLMKPSVSPRSEGARVLNYMIHRLATAVTPIALVRSARDKERGTWHTRTIIAGTNACVTVDLPSRVFDCLDTFRVRWNPAGDSCLCRQSKSFLTYVCADPPVRPKSS